MKRKVSKKRTTDSIKSHLEDRGIKQTWLAQKADLSSSHLSNVLANRVLLTEPVLEKINQALGTNFQK